MPELQADYQHVTYTMPLLLSAGRRAGRRSRGGSYEQSQPGMQRRQLCSILAGSLIGFWLLAFVPFMGLVGLVGYYVLLVLVPVLAIRWWVRFSSLRSEDPDYRRAKRNVGIA